MGFWEVLCRDRRLISLGVAARAARGREGSVIVSASSIASWHWCPLKAWHDTTLFNSGWLSRREVSRHIDALASLWAAELARSKRPAVRRGKRIHGEYVAAELEILEPCEIVYSGVYGMIEPGAYKRQLARLESARDPVDYYRVEEWPLFRYVGEGYEILGVPDGVERGEKGYVVIELKSTSDPRRFEEGPGLQAAMHQVAAYILTLSSKWPVEKAVLLVADRRGRVVKRFEWRPDELSDVIENVKRIAARLASTEPPVPQGQTPCRTCEYSIKPVRCSLLELYESLEV